MAGYKAFTQEWMDAWKEKINSSKEYKEIAKECVRMIAEAKAKIA